MYLEGSADTEDAVVGILSGETLQGLLDDVVLLGDQVVKSGLYDQPRSKMEGN